MTKTAGKAAVLPSINGVLGVLEWVLAVFFGFWVMWFITQHVYVIIEG